MAGLKIEGDLSQISDQQLTYIKSVIEKRGYINSNVVIEAVGKAGDNYVANVKRISVDDNKGGTFKIIAKVAPHHEALRQLGNTDKLFRNESIMYTKVLPKLTQFEEAAEVPPNDRLRYAACYGSFEEAPNEVILLEDLNETGFIMLDRLKPLQPDCVKSVLKNFALLHSLSYALKSKEPLLYEEYKSSLSDVWSEMYAVEDAVVLFTQMENSATMVVESDVHKNALKGAVSRGLQMYEKLAKSDYNSKFSVIQQGDAWTNNIMFKFDGETLSGSIMIDYQVSKSANPVVDLLYMILNCTDYESRKKHFYDWIDYYHSELEKSLSNYGLKANFVYPRDQLDADLKRYAKIVFGLAIMLAGVLSMSTEEAGDIKEAMETADIAEMTKSADLSQKDPKTIAIFKKKVEGLVDSLHELGFL